MTGEGLNLVPVNTPAVFTIHTNGAGGGKVDVNIVGKCLLFSLAVGFVDSKGLLR